MSTKGLEVIDHSAQTAHEWVSELAGRLDYVSRPSAMRLLRTTLRLVRDHLLIDELAQFAAQLPLLIRGMFFEGWVPKRTPIRDRSAEGFLRAIEDQMGDAEDYRGAEDVKYVFELLNAHLTAGEIEDVRSSLPPKIRAFWPKP
jgi:uncharacterized protein (DUF2267 family)